LFERETWTLSPEEKGVLDQSAANNNCFSNSIMSLQTTRKQEMLQQNWTHLLLLFADKN